MPVATIPISHLTVDERPLPELPNLPFQRGESNGRLIDAGLRAAGTAIAWPTDTQTVLSLCKLIGYAVDRSTLSYCLKMEYLDQPAKVNGQFRWQRSDAIALCDALESLRRWIPCHPAHLAKYNPRELADATTEAKAKLGRIRELVSWGHAELVDAMMKASPQMQEEIAVALKVKGGSLHLRGCETPAADPAGN